MVSLARAGFMHAVTASEPLASQPIWAGVLQHVRDQRWGPDHGSDTNQLIIEVTDDAAGDRARLLNGKVVHFPNGPSKGEILKSRKSQLFCDRCFRWGHNGYLCKQLSNMCAKCGAAHSLQYHQQLAECCAESRDVPCTHPARCVNCGRDHYADLHDCEFYIERYDQEWHKNATTSQHRVAFAPVRR